MTNEEYAVDSLPYVNGYSFVKFSPDGSWTVAIYDSIPDYSKGLRKYWKWHPVIPRRMLWCHLGQSTAETNYLDIRVVSKDSLKITHYNVDGSAKLNFIPYN